MNTHIKNYIGIITGHNISIEDVTLYYIIKEN